MRRVIVMLTVASTMFVGTETAARRICDRRPNRSSGGQCPVTLYTGPINASDRTNTRS